MNATNYLAEEKISKLMLKFSVPCIMSLLVSSLYNIVDQIFIGRGVGYLGNGATNVVFPITVIALALALMIGDGCAAHLSLCLGRGKTEEAEKSAGTAITISVLAGVVMMVLFLAGTEKIISLFGATENNIEYAREYFHVIAIGIPFYVFTNAMNSIIRADGSPKFAMFSTLIGCIINCILDPIAIFVLHWGMFGAALATIIGQIVTALLAAWYMILCCIQKATSVFLQSLGKTATSFTLSLTRDIVINIGIVLILPRYIGLTGTLLSAPIADIVSFVLVILMIRKVFSSFDTNSENSTKTSGMEGV